MFKKMMGYFRYRKIISDNFEIITQRYRFRYSKKTFFQPSLLRGDDDPGR